MGLRKGLTGAIFALKPGRQGASLAKIRGKCISGGGKNKCKDLEPAATLAAWGQRPGQGQMCGVHSSARESSRGTARAAAGSLGVPGLKDADETTRNHLGLQPPTKECRRDLHLQSWKDPETSPAAG